MFLISPVAHSENIDSVFEKFKDKAGQKQEKQEKVQEKKEEIAEMKEAKRLRICVHLEEKIDTKVARFHEHKGSHANKYQKLKERLERIVSGLEDKGYDVGNLKEDLVELNRLIEEYAQLYTDFIDSLRYTRGFACGKLDEDFRDKMGESKEKLRLLKEKRAEIREFYKTVIREDLKELRKQASEMDDVDESTSSEE